MDVLNIYSQRLGKNMPPRIATRLHGPISDSTASQTELTCPPSKNVSLQTKLPLRSSGSQTDFPPPKPPTRTLSVIATQTDMDVDSKNEILEVSNAPQASSSEPQHPISKPVEVETKVEAKTDAPKMIARSPTKASGTVVSGGGKTINVDVEEQKKRELLATLRAMDAQKDPPGSQPMVSSTVKSTAQPTSNATVGGERPTGKVTRQSTQVPPSQPAEGDEDKAQKKKLLLAKLMAIDEGSDPSKVTMSKMDVSKPQPQAKQSTSGRQSSSSIQSWPDTVENMYNGKPAFATEEDPFGSRHSSGKKVSSTKSKEFFLTEGGGGDSPKSKRLNRRHQLEQKKSLNFNSDISMDSKVVPQAHEQESTQAHGYQPTFGRRAGASNAASHKPKNGMIFGDLDNLELPTAKKTEPPSSLPFKFEAGSSRYEGRDYPWETRVNVSSNPPASGGERPMEGSKMDGGPLSSPSMVFGYVGQEKTQLQSRSKGSLLPLREKAGANVTPGSVDIAEPDDLEELAL